MLSSDSRSTRFSPDPRFSKAPAPQPPSRRDPVKYVTMYWHFLDVVWIVMFGVLLVTG